MYRIIVILAMFLALVAGCSQKESPVGPNAAEPQADTAANPAKESTARSLADGYRPTFKYVMRSQRHVKRDDGRFLHVVIVEFLGTDKQSVIKTLRRDLEARGFSVDGPVEHGDASRLTAKKSGVQMIADVNDSPSLEMKSPDAKGIVYFSWQDRKQR